MDGVKKSWKLHEFSAHGADVKCLGLGHMSGRVMVTGGDDRKVNLWSVGKAHCVMSLSGHTTAIEAVRFGHLEELVVAGSQSGALKVWNLEQAKVLRTLTGHKAGIRSLDFHPSGEYAASGSMDCNVKLWDLKRKGCIYTYKGHSGAVNCLRFSPDGRWIASASEDSIIKLWDLTAGKLLTDFNLHLAAVNTIEFHPHELLLASGSNDRTVKFWDLDTFHLVSSTDCEVTPVRSILFHPNGLCLYSGSKDMLKVYGWEPVKCHEVVPITWGNVCDMSVSNTQLIGSSYYKTSVSCFVVDIEKLSPLSTTAVGSSARQDSTCLNHGRRSFVTTDRPLTQSSCQTGETKSTDMMLKGDDGDGVSVADIRYPASHKDLFPVKCRQEHAVSKRFEKFEPPLQNAVAGEKQHGIASNSVSNCQVRSHKPVQRSPPICRRSSPMFDDKVSINAEDFFPKETTSSLNVTEGSLGEFSERGHSPMMVVLSGRKRNIQLVRAMWTSGSPKAAVDSAICMKDPAVLVDVLNVLHKKTSLWNLDVCSAVLPQLKDLLNSKYESHAMVAGQATKLVVRELGQTIQSNISCTSTIGVDICQEERQRKCQHCHAVLMDIRCALTAQRNVSSRLLNIHKEIITLMSVFD